MKYTVEQLNFFLQSFYKKTQRVPTRIEFDKFKKYPSSSTYVFRFGSWNKSLLKAKLLPNKKKYSKIEMLNSIKAQKATTDSVEINYRSGLKVLGHSKKRGNKPKRNIYGLNDKNQRHVKDFIENVIDDRIIKFNKKKIKFDIKI